MTIQDNLDFITELMLLDRMSSKSYGFVTITKVDTNTFTISIDDEEYSSSLPKDTKDETTTK